MEGFMRIAVTGSSGLIGTALVERLRADGHEPVPVVRPGGGGDGPGSGLRWDPAAGTIDAAGFEGLDAVVHLAGAGIGDKKWTPERKQVILESRTGPTRLLAETLAGLSSPPPVLVSGSAVGWYGDRGTEVLTEASAPPEPRDFLAEVTRDWEAATEPAERAGIRTVHLRTGIVLSGKGGVLTRLALPFKLGVGGKTGSGKQYMSWVHIDDEVGAILHAITHPVLSGPVNVTAPVPVTNAEMTAALGRVLKRPTFLPTPLPAIRLVYGSELVHLLLEIGQRAVPDRLTGSGFVFTQPDLDGALRAALGR
jgi:uncharacterized protein (TIGR01777 family)